MRVRKFSKNRIFQKYKKNFSSWRKKLIKGTISMKEYENIKIPEKFEERFKENKNLLCDEYYKELAGFIDQNLKRFKRNM